MKKIPKIGIDLLADQTKEYEEAKAKYIAEYTIYEPGHSAGLFGWKSGRSVNQPEVGVVASVRRRIVRGCKDHTVSKIFRLAAVVAQDGM